MTKVVDGVASLLEMLDEKWLHRIAPRRSEIYFHGNAPNAVAIATTVVTNSSSFLRCSSGSSSYGTMHGCSFASGFFTGPNFHPVAFFSSSHDAWLCAGPYPCSKTFLTP